MHLEKDEKKMERHLREIYSKGVDLYLEGEPASPEEIARKFFVNEDTVYMPDFVTDEDGTLREVGMTGLNTADVRCGHILLSFLSENNCKMITAVKL